MASKFGPGFVYGVAAGRGSAAWSAVKLGLTRQGNPVVYCRRQYERVLWPLNIIRIVEVPNAGLAEQMLFEALAPYRVSRDRELFDMTGRNQDLEMAFDSLKPAFEAIHGSDPKPRRGVAEYPLEEYRQALRDSAPSLATLSEEELCHAKRARVDVFMASKCVFGPPYAVSARELFDAFKAFSKSNTPAVAVSASEMYAILRAKGFTKEMVRTGSRRLQGFHGVGLKPGVVR